MLVDSWGNEFETKEEALAEIHEICKEGDYWEMIGEYMCIDSDIMHWIVENHLESFRNHFATIIEKAEKEWCEDYFTFEVREEN